MRWAKYLSARPGTQPGSPMDSLGSKRSDVKKVHEQNIKAFWHATCDKFAAQCSVTPKLCLSCITPALPDLDCHLQQRARKASMILTSALLRDLRRRFHSILYSRVQRISSYFLLNASLCAVLIEPEQADLAHAGYNIQFSCCSSMVKAQVPTLDWRSVTPDMWDLRKTRTYVGARYLRPGLLSMYFQYVVLTKVDCSSQLRHYRDYSWLQLGNRIAYEKYLLMRAAVIDNFSV